MLVRRAFSPYGARLQSSAPAFWIARKTLVYGIHCCERRIADASNETGYVNMMENFGREPRIVVRSE
jgi:hypothetical protein